MSFLNGGRFAWRAQMLRPTIVVVTVWWVMSVGTTFYLSWMQSSYDAVLSVNFESIRAAESIESMVWKCVADRLDETRNADQLQIEWTQQRAQLLDWSDRIRQSAYPELQRADPALTEPLRAFCMTIDSDLLIRRTTGEPAADDAAAVRSLAMNVAEATARIRADNDQLVQTALRQLAAAQSHVLVIRMLMLVLGPIVGVYLGWRLSDRLHRAVSSIATTLSESIGVPPEAADTAAPAVGHSVIDEARRQADRVASRIRRTDEELKSARDEVLQSERRAAVGELAAGVAHELRNPLTSVKLLLQHASASARNPHIERTEMNLILGEIRRMESTIQGLLDFSRTPKLNRVSHDLRDTLQKSLNLLDGRLKQRQIALVTVQPPSAVIVDGDHEQLCQVFVNLLLNAIDALPDGGRIDLLLTRSAESQTVVVRIHDSGPGIAPQILSRLFEPFATTKERGTGLGLAVSQRIILAHGGILSASNHADGGAVISVELPDASVGSDTAAATLRPADNVVSSAAAV